jgi:hypothetical protein
MALLTATILLSTFTYGMMFLNITLLALAKSPEEVSTTPGGPNNSPLPRPTRPRRRGDKKRKRKTDVPLSPGPPKDDTGKETVSEKQDEVPALAAGTPKDADMNEKDAQKKDDVPPRKCKWKPEGLALISRQM